MQKVIIFLFLLATLNLIDNTPALAKGGHSKFISGPVPAKIIEIIDGDTILVDANPWPRSTVRVYVRLRDINTPELRSRCKKERLAAQEAKNALLKMVNDEDIVLYNIAGGKYYGRVLANVRTHAGLDVSNQMLKTGFALPYKKGKKFHYCQTS